MHVAPHGESAGLGFVFSLLFKRVYAPHCCPSAQLNLTSKCEFLKKLQQGIPSSLPHSSYRKALSKFCTSTYTEMHFSDSIVCIFCTHRTRQL